MSLTWSQIIEEKVHTNHRVKNRYEEGKEIVKKIYHFYLNYTKNKIFEDREFEDYVSARKGDVFRLSYWTTAGSGDP